MTRINLLPWREELRKEKQREFLSILGLVAFLAVGIVFVGIQNVSGSVESQKSRNKFIEKEINVLDASIKEIEQLQTRRDELVERMNVIQGLQGNRPIIVNVFDAFVRNLPEGVYFDKLTHKSNRYEVSGIAESNSRVSRLMRQLEASEWFQEPNLSKVVADDNQLYNFTLSVQQQMPARGDEDDENGS